jgi:hypothetical protein
MGSGRVGPRLDGMEFLWWCEPRRSNVYGRAVRSLLDLEHFYSTFQKCSKQVDLEPELLATFEELIQTFFCAKVFEKSLQKSRKCINEYN